MRTVLRGSKFVRNVPVLNDPGEMAAWKAIIATPKSLFAELLLYSTQVDPWRFSSAFDMHDSHSLLLTGC